MDTLEAQLASDLAAIVSDVWEAFMLGEVEVRPDVAGQEGPLTCASVCLSGAWEGVVMIESGPAAADLLCATLLGMELGEAVEADIADTLGEMANVVGGNLKSVLPGPTLLSLPVVTSSSSPALVKDAVEVCSAGLHWSGQALRVVVCNARS